LISIIFSMPGGVAARGRRAFLDLAEQVCIELRILAARADEAVAEATGQLGRQRPGGGHEDRHGLIRAVVHRRALRAVVRPVEIDALLRPEPADELDGLGQALASFLPPGQSKPVGAVSLSASPVPTPRNTRPGSGRRASRSAGR
jgi:hypothetical protein